MLPERARRRSCEEREAIAMTGVTDGGSHSISSRTEDGDTLAAISRRIVRLYKEYYGKGPTRARTYYWRDLVVVVLRDGFTQLEQTLHDGGRGKVVLDVRAEFQE